ncbi:MAG: endolytic transglycosylase MltG [Candidatus Marinimicrobia bacterium]|nr:endolytic transglycosylase MltG [Candidatus Neomarinimicrobiota bacterium]
MKFIKEIKRLYDELPEAFQFTGLVLATGLLILLAYGVNILNTPVSQSKQEFRINEGLTVKKIAEKLEHKDIINDLDKFIMAVKIKGKSKQLKAGFYRVKNVDNYSQLINMLVANHQYAVKITIPEGSTNQEIAQIVSPYYSFSDSNFLATTKKDELINSYNLDVNTLEGYLFPDTYYFVPEATPEKIIRKMVKTLFSRIKNLQPQIESSSYTLHEILTLASIVEGECILDKERPIVASLYYNRLRKRMHLNADPTIQYIIPDGPRRIFNGDLEISSPYNTYINYGLPPGPVNNPGLKSIQAAVNPADTDYLYMVAKGNGEHVFTRNYNQFLKYKQDFQQYRQKVNNQK